MSQSNALIIDGRCYTPHTIIGDCERLQGLSFLFLQFADPQFGMYEAQSLLHKTRDKEHHQLNNLHTTGTSKFTEESHLYQTAIDFANKIKPDFIVTCGDMVNDIDQPDQFQELIRITESLNHNIPYYWVAGNHDVGNIVNTESLYDYRLQFGDDNYFFDHSGSRFIVLNSNIINDPTLVPAEWSKQLAFVEHVVGEARSQNMEHIIIFTHHPLFLQNSEEDDPGNPLLAFTIPLEKRRILLEIFQRHRVSAVFSGHLHRNFYGKDRDLEMVTSGPIGYPLGDDPSGLRVVKISESRIAHEYFSLNQLPESTDFVSKL